MCGAYKGSDLLIATQEMINDDMIKDSKRLEFRKKTYEKQQNEDKVSELKRILNYFIDYRFKEKIIDGLITIFLQGVKLSFGLLSQYAFS